FRPHSPYVAPKKYFDLYDANNDLPVPPHTTLPDGAPPWSGHNSGELRRYTDQPNGKTPIPESAQRRIRHAYCACVSFVDAQVGRVLDELDRQGLADNTVVVLLGDHGYHLGEKSLWGKTTNFELDTRVPLIVRIPDMQHAGQQSDSLVELLDIYPTLVDLAELPRNVRTEGVSLRPVLENPASSTKAYAFSQHPRSDGLMGYSVRSSTHRLTRWIHRETNEVRATELYRYTVGDPNESANIADDPHQQPIIERLSGALVQEVGISPSSPTDSPKVPERNRDGQLSIARVFGDGMVLQCEAPIRVWGDAPSNAAVQVTLGDLRREVHSDASGRWIIEFPPQAASSLSRNLSASCRDHIVTIGNVLLGEVWLCAGQSNMDFEWRNSARAVETASSADDAELRLLDFAGAVTGTAGKYDPRQLSQLDPRWFSDGIWRVSNRESAANFSAVGFYFATSLRHELDRPIGMIDVSIGGTPIESWINPDQLRDHSVLASMMQGNWLDNESLGEWCRSRARGNLQNGLEGELAIPGDELGPNHSFKPGFLYRSAIEPLSPMSIRGVLWYQGESNADSAARCQQYGPAFELLVNSWREEFGNPGMPFGFVQLPPMNRPSWPVFRELQRRNLSAHSHLGMAVTMDVGDPDNVHPNRKSPVGERLAQWALATVYDRHQLPAMGPLFQEATSPGNRIVVRFETGSSGLLTTDDDAPRHFEIAGSDLEFHAARAVINGNEITLTSEDVPRPLHVRYAWLPVPEPPVNLVNSYGTPASPFTTVAEFWRE
ncbi:MAG: sulfatase-like hydrolase/transferase, partial [Pirellulaceae bacterium]